MHVCRHMLFSSPYTQPYIIFPCISFCIYNTEKYLNHMLQSLIKHIFSIMHYNFMISHYLQK
jgi:hypothetical protein